MNINYKHVIYNYLAFSFQKVFSNDKKAQKDCQRIFT